MDRPPSPTAASAPRTGTDAAVVDPELETTLLAFANHDYWDRFRPERPYEDKCDRIALRALLPPGGDRLIEVGTGFGLLADEYGGYREVVLLDPSEVMLGAARGHDGDDPRFTTVQGHTHDLPFAHRTFDAVVCVRVVHHLRYPRPAIAELARVLRPGGVLVLESANMRNLKAILAYALRRRPSPFSSGSDPYEDVSLAPPRRRDVPSGPSSAPQPAATEPPRWSLSTWYLHAPREVRAWLRSVGLSVEATRSVGLFRARILTGRFPVRLLVGLERVTQPGLARLAPGPSIYLRAVRRPEPPVTEPDRMRGDDE